MQTDKKTFKIGRSMNRLSRILKMKKRKEKKSNQRRNKTETYK